MSRSTGLGAALSLASLADPISFYAVTDGHYYRHHGGRVFRLVFDRAAIKSANDQILRNDAPHLKNPGIYAAEIEALPADDGADEAGGIDFREVPPDVIAHVFARPIATWQLESELGEEVAALAHDLVDDIDAHVIACPLAALPTPTREPVLQLTCDIAIVVLAAIEPATIDTLATTLRGRGVNVDHAGKLRAKLLGLAEIDDVERDVPPDEREALWTCTEKGHARARAVQAALADLAE
jgi:hypothetical protein